MKYINYTVVSLLLFSSLLVGCSDKESTLSRAVLASTNILNFEATGTSEKIITVYADADWVTEAPQWVKVTPNAGTGTMDVTISVTENMRDGAMDNPRKANLVFKGGTLESQVKVMISQEGDKYRDCKEYKLNELSALSDDVVVSVPQVIVTAVTTKGLVVSDGTVNIFMQSSSAVSVGNKVSVKGVKLTDTHSLLYVECDQVKVNSTVTVTYPVAKDITDKIDTYTSTSRSFISVSGILNGNKIVVEGSDYSVAMIDVPESLGIAKLNGHKVKVKGYFAGVAAPIVKVLAATIEDKGIIESIYFADDFEWLQPWAQAGGAGQTIEKNDPSAAAPQIYADGTTYDGKKASEALLGRGYGLEEIPGAAIYLQKNYLKFGKTNYQAGITIPAIEGIPLGTKLKLAFDWAPMMGGTGKFDPVKVIVYVYEGEKIVFESDPIGHSLVDTVDKLTWLHAEVSIEGINFSGNTRISIRSDGWGDNKANTGANVYKRWFIDNIKIVKAN